MKQRLHVFSVAGLILRLTVLIGKNSSCPVVLEITLCFQSIWNTIR